MFRKIFVETNNNLNKYIRNDKSKVNDNYKWNVYELQCKGCSGDLDRQQITPKFRETVAFPSREETASTYQLKGTLSKY